ncbi:uncharacterized protein MAM_05815 [Metarhizium album ARSEF 1941]|uniref:Uncharacterized protein n=1 Tax=Metarhizium album (strain ARSEF 1941) TaxID=1081103 RepID=A0A0B2WRJ4_METAS|nr:uncharacterized protein MAM_05815 [Metarhizium album ARSEF 1941]KHN96229.1 hypothetical protein MAM_05815 [Metarhizium album ARSEF 1941]
MDVRAENKPETPASSFSVQAAQSQTEDKTSSPAMTSEDAKVAIPVPWDRLLLWVQRQIAVEMQTGHPVALTPPQLQALSQFVPFNVEPDVSDHDYISQLMRHVDDNNSREPCQREAVTYLALATAKAADSADDVSSELAAAPTLATEHGMLPQTNDAGACPPSSSSVFEKVSSLSSRLALDSPRYKIEPDPAGGGLFRGRPVFRNDVRIPPALGVVTGIADQDQARLKVAEGVLDWLQAELQRRQDTFESLWSSAA